MTQNESQETAGAEAPAADAAFDIVFNADHLARTRRVVRHLLLEPQRRFERVILGGWAGHPGDPQAVGLRRVLGWNPDTHRAHFATLLADYRPPLPQPMHKLLPHLHPLIAPTDSDSTYARVVAAQNWYFRYGSEAERRERWRVVQAAAALLAREPLNPAHASSRLLLPAADTNADVLLALAICYPINPDDATLSAFAELAIARLSTVRIFAITEAEHLQDPEARRQWRALYAPVRADRIYLDVTNASDPDIRAAMRVVAQLRDKRKEHGLPGEVPSSGREDGEWGERTLDVVQIARCYELTRIHPFTALECLAAVWEGRKLTAADLEKRRVAQARADAEQPRAVADAAAKRANAVVESAAANDGLAAGDDDDDGADDAADPNTCPCARFGPDQYLELAAARRAHASVWPLLTEEEQHLARSAVRRILYDWGWRVRGGTTPAFGMAPPVPSATVPSPSAATAPSP